MAKSLQTCAVMSRTWSSLVREIQECFTCARMTDEGFMCSQCAEGNACIL